MRFPVLFDSNDFDIVHMKKYVEVSGPKLTLYQRFVNFVAWLRDDEKPYFEEKVKVRFPYRYLEQNRYDILIRFIEQLVIQLGRIDRNLNLDLNLLFQRLREFGVSIVVLEGNTAFPLRLRYNKKPEHKGTYFEIATDGKDFKIRLVE